MRIYNNFRQWHSCDWQLIWLYQFCWEWCFINLVKMLVKSRAILPASSSSYFFSSSQMQCQPFKCVRNEQFFRCVVVRRILWSKGYQTSLLEIPVLNLFCKYRIQEPIWASRGPQDFDIHSTRRLVLMSAHVNRVALVNLMVRDGGKGKVTHDFGNGKENKNECK